MEGGFELATFDLESGVKSSLTNRRIISPTSFSFNKHHNRIVFSALAEDGEELFLMSPETKPWEVLTRGGNRFSHPSWSPDGEQIAVNSRLDADNYEIFLMEADGSNPRRLLSHGTLARNPTWSSDGHFIALLLLDSSDSSGEIPAEIGIFDLKSGNLSTYKTDLLDISLSRLAWSPTEPKLTFTANRGASRDLMTLDAVSGEFDVISETDEEEWFGVWSPGGKKIAFLSSNEDVPTQTSVMIYDFMGSTSELLHNNAGAIISMEWFDEEGILFETYDSIDDLTNFYILRLPEGKSIAAGSWGGMYFDFVVVP